MLPSLQNLRCAVVASLACLLAGGCTVLFPVGDYQALETGLVQQATTSGSNTRSLMVTLPAPTLGDALVLVAASVESTPTSISGGGVTWVQQSRSSAHVALAVWVGFAPDPGSSATVTVTWAASPAPAQPTALVHVSEWVGPTSMGTPIVSGGTGGPVTTSNLVVGDRAALVLAAAATHGAALGGPSNGFVALDPIALNDTRLAAAYQLSPAAGTYATSWSYAAGDSWDAVVMSFMQ